MIYATFIAVTPAVSGLVPPYPETPHDVIDRNLARKKVVKS